MTAMTAFENFQDKMTVRVETDDELKQFDPTIILAILSALIPLLQGCFKPTPASVRRTIHRPRLTVAIARETGLTLRQAASYSAAVMDVANTATDEELKAFISEATAS